MRILYDFTHYTEVYILSQTRTVFEVDVFGHFQHREVKSNQGVTWMSVMLNPGHVCKQKKIWILFFFIL